MSLACFIAIPFICLYIMFKRVNQCNCDTYKVLTPRLGPWSSISSEPISDIVANSYSFLANSRAFATNCILTVTMETYWSRAYVHVRVASTTTRRTWRPRRIRDASSEWHMWCCSGLLRLQRIPTRRLDLKYIYIWIMVCINYDGCVCKPRGVLPKSTSSLGSPLLRDCVAVYVTVHNYFFCVCIGFSSCRLLRSFCEGTLFWTCQ